MLADRLRLEWAQETGELKETRCDDCTHVDDMQMLRVLVEAVGAAGQAARFMYDPEQLTGD